tara:strand:- start:5440 stop:7515 length:2076 start_codon:yes stop_codon:yes gene_type:complete
MSGGYFTTDRARKYGWGVPRLLLLTVCAFEVVPRFFLNASSDDLEGMAMSRVKGLEPGESIHHPLKLLTYLHSMRWLGHAYMGSIGAGVNVQVLGFVGNLAMLLAAAAFCVWDVRIDYSIVIYLAKTFSGDFLAGKLDTAEWRLVLFWTFGVLGPAMFLLAGMDGEAIGVDAINFSQSLSAFSKYSRILPVLFLIQTVCEFGDAHLEHHRLVGKFFRHRYGFEFFTSCCLTLLPGGITPYELLVVQHDLVICLFYRISNLAIILHKNGLYKSVGASVEKTSRKALFRVFGFFSNQKLVNITDIDTAVAVLKASSVKGDGLERHVASPAWRPLLSLESVDGKLYDDMVGEFHKLVKHLPPPGLVAELAETRVEEMLRAAGSGGIKRGKVKTSKTDKLGKEVTTSEVEVSLPISLSSQQLCSSFNAKGNSVIDAHQICRLSLAVFVEYVFQRKWEQSFEILVDASWEWRREIAARGVADPQIKKAAVELVVNDLLRNNEKLWAIHGEKWREPRYYSLIMQPFLISPAINVGDVAVALKMFPETKLEDTMRKSHPFPIFERFVDEDVYVTRSGKKKKVIKKDTQVIMFTSDFCDSDVKWPVFGAGPRMCAGTSMALGVLRAVANGFEGCENFKPEIGHKYSGRHNDGVSSFSEAIYFTKTVVPIVFGFGRSGSREWEVEDKAREALEGALEGAR